MNRITTSVLLLLLSIIVLTSGCHSTASPPEAESSAASTAVLLPPPSEEITTIAETTTAETSVPTSVAEILTTTERTIMTTTTATEAITATRQQTTVTTTKKHTSTTQRSTTAKPITTTTTATQSKPAALDTEVIAEKLLRLINAEREALGLIPLNTAPIAHEIATVRARELQEEWSHYRPASSKYPGTTVASLYTEFAYGEKTNNEFAARDSGGNTVWIPIVMPPLNSENISRVSVPVADSTVESITSVIVEGFRGSSGHWQDLMNDAYTGVGIGVTIRTVGDQGQWYEVHTAVLTMSRVYG